MAKKPDTTILPILDGSFDEVANAMVSDGSTPPKSDGEMIEATHKGILPLGGLQLDCYVLSDGRRVFHKLSLIHI